MLDFVKGVVAIIVFGYIYIRVDDYLDRRLFKGKWDKDNHKWKE
jgi:hypothetical protein